VGRPSNRTGPFFCSFLFRKRSAYNVCMMSISIEAESYIPSLVSGTLYLTGTSIYISICAWLHSILIGNDRQILLQSCMKKYVLRTLCISVFASACMVLYIGRVLEEGIIIILPETIFFVLLSGFYIVSLRRAGSEWKNILRGLFVVEPVKIIGLILICALVWALSFFLGKGSIAFLRLFDPAGYLEGFAVFMVVGFWFILPLMIIARINRNEETKISMKVVLWPILLSVICFISPLLLEILVENIASGKWATRSPIEKV